MKRKKSTFRASCDGLVYEDEDGEEFFPRVGQFVEFKLKKSANDYEMMDWFAELSDAAREADRTIEAAQSKSKKAIERAEEAVGLANRALVKAASAMAAFVGKKIVAWNWTDLDAEPDEDGNFPALPPPTMEFVKDMDFDIDVTHLVTLLMGDSEEQKKES